jgi:hypothetical protein
MKFVAVTVLFFLLPFLSAIILNSIDRNLKWVTYLSTVVLGIFYPVIVVQTFNYFNLPPAGPRCTTGEAALILCAWVIGIPSLLFLQMIVNLFYPQKDNSSSVE